MSDRPNLYGFCPSGCQYETVHKADFTSRTLTVAVADWTGASAPFTKTLTIADLTNDDVVNISAPFSLFNENGLIVSQSGDTITFSVTTKPSASVDINIAISPSTAVIE